MWFGFDSDQFFDLLNYRKRIPEQKFILRYLTILINMRSQESGREIIGMDGLWLQELPIVLLPMLPWRHTMPFSIVDLLGLTWIDFLPLADLFILDCT